MAGASEPGYVHTSEKWRFEIDGTQLEHCTDATLPTISFSPQKFATENATANPETSTVQGQMNGGTCSVSKFLNADDTTLQDWIKEGDPVEGGGAGKVTKKDITFYVADTDGDYKKITCEGAWISSLSYSSGLDSNGGDAIKEVATFHYDIVKPEAG